MKKYTITKTVVVEYYFEVEAKNLDEIKETIEEDYLGQENGYNWQEELSNEVTFSHKGQELKKDFGWMKQ